MTAPSRLERALAIYLANEGSQSSAEVIAANPELADLLAPLFAGEDAPAAGPEEHRFGDFRLVREVGRGGMGIVYEARQLSLDRRVALKVLGTGAAPSATQVARFRREAMVLAKLEHPHIVRVLDVGETDGRHWLAMEFVDGESLDRRIERLRAEGGHRGGSLRELVTAVADVAEALQHVHAAGILHRDLKPSNVLLRQDGRALLGDFGLARDEASPAMTQTGVIAGTPHYMSPEHLAGGDLLTPQSDVFSLGATLYECITLRRPFDGPGNDQVLRRILLAEPPDPRRLHANLPADLAAIVLKALEKEPTRRYATAADFADDLRAFLDLRPVRARTPTTVLRLRRWVRREPATAGLVVAGSLALMLGALLVAWLPSVRAAAVTERERRYEDEVSSGLMARVSRRRDAAYEHFRGAMALFPERGEAVAQLALTVRLFEGVEPALALLDAQPPEHRDEAVQRARVLVLQIAGRSAEADRQAQGLGVPSTATALLLACSAMLAGHRPGDALPDKALEYITLAKNIEPQPRLSTYVQWAIVAHLAQDRTAEDQCSRALLELWPAHPFGLHYAALGLARSDPQRAVALARKARELGMDEQEHLFFLADTLSHTDRRDELLATIRMAMRLPYDEIHRASMLQMLRDANANTEALEEAQRWLAQEPKNATAQRQTALTLCATEQTAASVPIFRELAAAHPDDVEAQYDLAVALHITYADAEATAQCEKVLAMQPGHTRAHSRLVGLYAEGPPETAIARADKLFAESRRYIAARPDDAEAWFELGKMAAAAFGAEHDAAVGHEASAALMQADYLTGGKNPEILLLRAQLHEQLGDQVLVAALRERAAKLADKAAPAKK